MTAQVSLVNGEDRYQNIRQALELIAAQVDLQGKQRVVIKPNIVSISHQLASTHMDAVRAVLDFVRARYNGPIFIAEGSALNNTWEGFANFGFEELAQAYGVKLVDLNADTAVPIKVYNRQLQPNTLHIAQTILQSDFRISVGPPKTHDTVIVTLSLKNMIMGSLVNRQVAGRAIGLNKIQHSPLVQRLRSRLGQKSDKWAMHQGFPVMNLNLALLAPLVKPHLSVIDGFQAMEGAGPVNGDPVEWRIALVGTDALAVDWLTTSLMGFDPACVGYLAYCAQMGLGTADLGQIHPIGNITTEAARYPFRPHPTFNQQSQWHLPDVAHRLQPAPIG